MTLLYIILKKLDKMNNPIKINKNGSILEVTIDRPKANAIDQKTSIILGETFSNFRDDPELKVAIITGEGQKFFSAGWDLKAVSEGEQADADYGVGGFGGLQELPNLNKPRYHRLSFLDIFQISQYPSHQDSHYI